MKKFYSLLAATAMVATVSAQNLVQNPSFESGFTGGWAKTSTNYTEPVVVEGGAQDGNKYVKYENLTKTTGFYQNIPVNAGEKYVLTFYYKAKSTESGKTRLVRLWSVFRDKDGEVIYLAGDKNNATEDPLRTKNDYLPVVENWTKHEVEFTAPAEVVSLDLAVRAYRGGTVSFDNFSLVKKSDLAVIETDAKINNIVKNTVVENQILFGAKANVKIYNANGQVVKTASVNDGEALNVSALPKGFYVVAAEVNGQAVSQKIIKK